MTRLSILLADDQEQEVADARRVLYDMGHDVKFANRFDEAVALADAHLFDIAVIDLGWFTDEVLVGRVGKDKAGAAGWELIEKVRSRNPRTVPILYSTRLDDPGISQTATSMEVYSVKKTFTDEGRERLTAVVTVVAHRLAIEHELHARIKQLESKQEQNLAERMKDETTKFRRTLLTALILPTAAVALLVVAWVSTHQIIIAALAFLVSLVLVLVVLRAIRYLSDSDIRFFGGMLLDLVRDLRHSLPKSKPAENEPTNQ